MRRACMVVVALVLGGATVAEAQWTVFPEWAGREHDVIEGEREALIADRFELFAAARPTTEARIEGAVLLCRVAVTEPASDRWDTFADPDLLVTLAAGRHRTTAWGTENADDEVVSFAGVDLVPGLSLRFRVSDRDVTDDEAIGTVTARFDGTLPITASRGHVSIECRAMDVAEAARRRREALSGAEALMRAAEEAVVDLSAPDLGAPPILGIEDELVDAFAYGGLRDAEARGIAQRLRAHGVAFTREVRNAVRALAGEAPRVGTAVSVGGADVQVEELVCGARAVARRFAGSIPPETTCVVTLRLSLGVANPERALGTPDVIDEHGIVAGATDLAVDPDEPGRWIVPFSPRVTDRMLLRLGAERRVILALR